MKNHRQSSKLTDTTEEKEDAEKQGAHSGPDWLLVISRSFGSLEGTRRSSLEALATLLPYTAWTIS